jgi:hypothetical protein
LHIGRAVLVADRPADCRRAAACDCRVPIETNRGISIASNRDARRNASTRGLRHQCHASCQSNNLWGHPSDLRVVTAGEGAAEGLYVSDPASCETYTHRREDTHPTRSHRMACSRALVKVVPWIQTARRMRRVTGGAKSKSYFGPGCGRSARSRSFQTPARIRAVDAYVVPTNSEALAKQPLSELPMLMSVVTTPLSSSAQTKSEWAR